MSKILYWVDDTHDVGKPPSPAEQKRLEKGLKVSLAIRTVKNRKQFDELLAQLDSTKGKDVAGVIMDYQLTGVGENGLWAYLLVPRSASSSWSRLARTNNRD